MAPWVSVLLQILTGYARQEGKNELADLIDDGLALAQSGKNVDAELQRVAEEWQTVGAPSHESIIAARKAIQAAIGD